METCACTNLKRDITLIVKPTHRCNLNCPYCYDAQNRSDHNYAGSDGTMSLEIVEKAAEIFKGRIGEWIWHGGEPLLMPVEYYYQANDIVLAKDPKARLEMQTNGTLIGREQIEMFKKYNIRPGMSFDGIKNEFTRKDTGKLMHVFRDLERNKLLFGAIMVLTPLNIHNIIDEYEYSKRLGIYTQMNIVFAVHGNEEKTTLEGDLVADEICKFYDYWIHDTVKPYNSALVMNYLDRLLNTGRQFCVNMDCAGKWFAIHPDGTIQPCGRDWTDENSFGNIMDVSSIEEIMSHPNFKRFKQQTSQMLDECSTCPFYYACKGGCFGNNYNANKNFLKPEPNYCHTTKKVLTHIYNDLKKVDMVNNLNEYNPIFIRHLMKSGFRNINLIKEMVEKEGLI